MKTPLQKVLTILRGLEEGSQKNPEAPIGNQEKLFAELHNELRVLSANSDENLKKLGELAPRIPATLNLKQFTHFIIPFERALDRSVRDDEFLVTSEDLALPALSKRQPDAEIVFVLDHLRSAFNVGSIFRTADTVGAKTVHLCGYTATPQDSSVAKTAMGAEKSLEFKQWPKLSECLTELRSQSYHIAALETASRASSIFSFEWPKKIAFVVGNERFGLDPSTLSEVDSVLQIPMYGKKNSLNVGVSLAVAAFAWARSQEGAAK